MRRDLAAHEKIMAEMSPERVRTVAAKRSTQRAPHKKNRTVLHKRGKSPVQVNGVRYASLGEARKRAGVGAGTIYKWLREGRAEFVE